MRDKELCTAVGKSHDTPEFSRIIVAGTMRRMYMVSKRKGMPICDYYVADGA